MFHRSCFEPAQVCFFIFNVIKMVDMHKLTEDKNMSFFIRESICGGSWFYSARTSFSISNHTTYIINNHEFLLSPCVTLLGMGTLCLPKNTLKSSISHLKHISVISLWYWQRKHGSHLLRTVVYSKSIYE